MKGNIYKMIPSITKEEILQNCEYNENIPDYGDVFTYDDFIRDVDCYAITDYDGNGQLMLFGKIVKDTGLWIYNKCVYFRGRFFVPFKVLYNLFGNDVAFIWFNK